MQDLTVAMATLLLLFLFELFLLFFLLLRLRCCMLLDSLFHYGWEISRVRNQTSIIINYLFTYLRLLSLSSLWWSGWTETLTIACLASFIISFLLKNPCEYISICFSTSFSLIHLNLTSIRWIKHRERFLRGLIVILLPDYL